MREERTFGKTPFVWRPTRRPIFREASARAFRGPGCIVGSPPEKTTPETRIREERIMAVTSSRSR
jgi:hypothetical protein